ncbi:MAG: CRTAC1 family protein [Acidimicrobiia bacterium]|nr:CRTAC1 family protein [Acidimicrobiia bacterium]NNF09876.1 CRTAC1 family protein [Acidimicrobiia bacterium]
MRSRLIIAVLALLAAACQADAPADAPASFVDVAAEVGLDFEHSAFHWDVSADLPAMMGGGLCWIDYDGDGWLDLFLTNTWTGIEWGRWYAGDGIPTSALYRNDRGRFEDVGRQAEIATELRGNGCVAADFDLDGHMDLYVTSDRANALFWNDGDGTFTEGARAAGVDANGWHAGAAVGDLNLDGWPDLFVAGYADINNRIEGAAGGFPSTFQPVRDLLFINQGPSDGGPATFVELGEELGVDQFGDTHEYGLGGVIADLDGSGGLDLYVANDTDPNRLYLNTPWPGGREADPIGAGFRLADAPSAGVDDDNSGMGVAAGDFSGDGRPDLFVTNLGSQLHSLYVNESGPSVAFADATAATGIGDVGGDYTGWGATWADLDLDTDLDLIVANGAIPLLDRVADAQPLQGLINDGSGLRLRDASGELGLSAIGSLLARGSAVADYDNDGDPDVAINSIGSPVTLLRNDVGGPWLTVELDGFYPGAVVKAVLPDGTAMVRTILAGSSYLSSEDPRAHFGLGAAESVAELVVYWPGGGETVLTDLHANQLVEVDHPGRG